MCRVDVFEIRVDTIFVSASDKVDLYECVFTDIGVICGHLFQISVPNDTQD